MISPPDRCSPEPGDRLRRRPRPSPRWQRPVSLPALLALAVSALLANHHSVPAIAEWGARQAPDHLRNLGFPAGVTPCQSTFQRLFCQLDGDSLAQHLTRWFQRVRAPEHAQVLQGVAIDGKAHRGRLVFADDGPVHVLSAFCAETGLVVGAVPITVTTAKAEAELTVAPLLLDQVDWHGRVLTGDALFCQRNLCRQVLDAGGEYLLVVKGNQPELHIAIMAYFDAPPALAGFPRVERTCPVKGVRKRAVRYGITSLDPAQGTSDRLLAITRGPWRKDVTFGEDASLNHAGQGPVVMATLRNAAVTLLHHHGITKVASYLRLLSQRPDLAIAMVVGSGVDA